ncbi:uncharacterized protein LOC110361099 [Columba livia]|uniref:uncharacterized protein LOC110361099 n=1 Tax=Columba livia TaxID=8932 RepID=UPI0031BB4AE8
MVPEPGRCCRRDLPSRHFPSPRPPPSAPPGSGAAPFGRARSAAQGAGGRGRREDGGGGRRRWLYRHVQQEILKLSVDVAVVYLRRNLLFTENAGTTYVDNIP